jgi:hypothetical protein
MCVSWSLSILLTWTVGCIPECRRNWIQITFCHCSSDTNILIQIGNSSILYTECVFFLIFRSLKCFYLCEFPTFCLPLLSEHYGPDLLATAQELPISELTRVSFLFRIRKSIPARLGPGLINSDRWIVGIIDSHTCLCLAVWYATWIQVIRPWLTF